MSCVSHLSRCNLLASRSVYRPVCLLTRCSAVPNRGALGALLQLDLRRSCRAAQCALLLESKRCDTCHLRFKIEGIMSNLKILNACFSVYTSCFDTKPGYKKKPGWNTIIYLYRIRYTLLYVQYTRTVKLLLLSEKISKIMWYCTKYLALLYKIINNSELSAALLLCNLKNKIQKIKLYYRVMFFKNVFR
jgi:hypothetical protein